jgi:diguanylate cyclase (GGDEF)-like protein
MTFFGLGMIALIWGAVEFHLRIERDRSEAGAIQSTGNLARVFEEQIIRTIRANDRMLRSLQLSSVNGTLLEDFKRWAVEVNESADFTIQLGLIDADGVLIGSSMGPIEQTTRLGDRDYFKAHLNSADTGLFIGKSIVGRMSGKWSIPLTRSLRTPEGEFAGIVFASLSSTRLAQFYESIDLGADGAIMIVGLDGGVRASAGIKIDVMERPMVGSQFLHRAATATEGFHYSGGRFDGTKRIASFRAVEGFPLVLWVGRAEQDVFGNYWRNSYSYRFSAAGLTLFILVIVFVNVRHRKGLERTQRELHASETNAREKSRELELTLDHMSQGIMMVDPDHTVALINRQATKLLGLPEDFTARRPRFEEVLEHQWANGEFGVNGESVEAHVRKFIRSGGVSGDLAVYERTRPNGMVLEISSNPLPNGGFVRTFTDISERKRTADKIAHMAHHDALTGLANRVLLRTHIEIALGRQRRHGEGFALLLIDLDRFKPVNDTFGHAAGDELLRCVAQRLRECVREVDVVARLGGDEFAILQVATANRECVEVLARRVVDVISAPYQLDGHPASVGASIGIARSADSPEIEQLFQNADLALYRVKAEGRNNFRLFEPEMNATAQAKRQMEEDLRHALAHGEFEIFYQPMFDLADGKVTAVEALLRWNHPLRGRIAPDAFMPLAEEIGLMPKVDAWVLETACTEAVGWPGEIVIAVNLSPAIFGQHTLAGSVQAALIKAGLPARRLELEISERIMLQEESGTLVHLRSLQDLGVRVALDDFGVAHSSLSDLRVFSFDKIKIDRSFVAEMEISQESAAIVSAIAGLGRSLGAVTTAEGIETRLQADLARAAGCIEAQGYLYSRPVPAAEIRALLNEAGARMMVA